MNHDCYQYLEFVECKEGYEWYGCSKCEKMFERYVDTGCGG